jgi:murein DD-endopeptidase MepM/ murein hydrolase activator NlpD
MAIFNTNPNPSQDLLDPFVKITLGKLGSKGAIVFTSGDGKLKDVSVTLSEGKNLSSCKFSVYEPDRFLTYIYFLHIELIEGLESFDTPAASKPNSKANSNVPQDAVTGTSGKVIFNSTKATVFNDKMGSRGNKLDTDNVFGCAMRYNNPAASKQFGSQGMVNSLNFGDKVKVTNLDNGKSCICEIQDWGPNPKLADRGIDLFTRAFNELTGTKGYQAAYNIGVLNNIKVEHIEKATTNADSSNGVKSKQQVVKQQSKEVKAQVASVDQSILNPQGKASLSVTKSKSPEQEDLPFVSTKAGSQITIELGYGGQTIAAYSFIHTGLKFSLFEPDTLEFTGQASSWVLTQRIKNTAYTNITFRKLAQKITSSYGMKLVMPEEGPKYNYFPQKGQTDYEALLTEAKRIGYRVYTKGATLYIQDRLVNTPNQQVYILKYGDNMGVSFEVSHQAITDSNGGARSSAPGVTTSSGERKFEIDPISGQVNQKRKENITGTGSSKDVATTGSPLPPPVPNVEGLTNAADSQRRANEDRIKGFIANAEVPTTPEVLILDPDTPFYTESALTPVFSRFWVIESITHTYSGGKFNTKFTCYAPFRNKRPSAAINSISTTSNPILNPSSTTGSNTNPTTFKPNSPSFIRPMTVGVVTSRHRSENPKRPNHKGIDISSVGGKGAGANVIASAAGTVTFAGFGANSNQRNGYGNVVDIDHGGGWMSRYAHLNSINVTVGQQVTQGQLIGVEGNSGFSFGTHLHTEIRLNNNDLNPLKFYKP